MANITIYLHDGKLISPRQHLHGEAKRYGPEDRPFVALTLSNGHLNPEDEVTFHLRDADQLRHAAGVLRKLSTDLWLLAGDPTFVPAPSPAALESGGTMDYLAQCSDCGTRIESRRLSRNGLCPDCGAKWVAA